LAREAEEVGGDPDPTKNQMQGLGCICGENVFKEAKWIRNFKYFWLTFKFRI
jgi:hypothetical protein